MSQDNERRVLVTGGTGFVGSHLVELLLSEGYTVSCLVRDTSRPRWLSALDVNIIEGDCLLPDSLAPAVRNVSSVFHVAGLTRARRSRDYYEVNRFGTKNIIEACAQHNPGLKKFIFISSLAAAGPGRDSNPVSVTDTPRPISDYGKSKLRAEIETLRFKDVFPVVILRPSAVYGPRDTDVYEFFRWAAKGYTIELSGGDRYFNPCFVKDLASAILSASETDTQSGSIYCVAEEQRYSWAEFRQVLLDTGRVSARNIKVPYPVAYLVGMLSEISSLFTSRPALTSRQKIREATQKYWLCDLRNIEHDLGFKAAYPLKRGLEITWKWYRDNAWI